MRSPKQCNRMQINEVEIELFRSVMREKKAFRFVCILHALQLL